MKTLKNVRLWLLFEKPKKIEAFEEIHLFIKKLEKVRSLKSKLFGVKFIVGQN